MALSDYSAYFEGAGKQYNVDPRLLAAVAQTESSGDPNALGQPTKYGTAQGIAQLLPSTAKSLGVQNPKDPQQAIYGMAKLLGENLDRYGNVTDAVKAYYGGTDKENWGPKTDSYPTKVAAAYSALKTRPQGSNMQSQSLSDADLLAALTGARSSPPSPPVLGSPAAPQASAAAQLSDADLLKALTGTPSRASAKAPSAPKEDSGAQKPAPGTPAWGFKQELLDLPTFGTADEISAAGGAAGRSLHQLFSGQTPTPGANYDAILPQVRASKAQYESEHPFWSTAAQIAGLGIGAPAAAGARAIPSIAQIGARAGEAVGDATGLPTLGRVIGGAITGGVGAGAYGFGSGEGGLQNRLQNAENLGETGAIIGGAIPLAAKAGSTLAHAVTGGGVNPLRANLAETAIDKYGIPVRGGQISESPFIQWLDSVLGKTPLSGYSARNEKSAAAFTRAVSKTFGEDADSLTPDVMSAAKSRIGKVFNDVAANTTIPDAADNVLKPIGEVIHEAYQVMPENEVSPLLKQLESIGSAIDPQTRALSGEAYQALTRKGTPLDRAMGSSNPNIRYYASQIRNVLDNALQQSAAPADTAALRNARLQWKNMRTVQDLAAKANIEGEISPQALLGAVKKSYKDMAYSGAGDIGELAKIGKEFLTDKPSSGTAERYTLYRLLEGAGKMMSHGIGGGLTSGAAGAAFYTNPLATTATVGGALGAARLAGSALGSDWYRNMLLQSAAKEGPNALSQFLSSPAAQAAISQAPFVGAVEGNRLLPPPQAPNPQ